MKSPTAALLAVFAIASLPVPSPAAPPPYTGDGQYSPTAGWINVTGKADKANKDYIRISGFIQYQGEKAYSPGAVVLKVGEITSVRKVYGLSTPSPAPSPGPDDDAAVIVIKLEREPFTVNVYVARNSEGFLQQFTGWLTGEEIRHYQ